MGNCRDTNNYNNPKAKVYEIFGERSRCFRLEKLYGNVCLEFEIVKDGLIITIQDKKLLCKSNYQKVKFEFYKMEGRKKSWYETSLRCPNIDDFIKKYNDTKCPYNCHFNGVCNKGKCHCFMGYNPEDHCESKL